MEKSDSDIPRVDLYRKTIGFNEKNDKNYKETWKSSKDHKNQNDQYLWPWNFETNPTKSTKIM